MNAGGGKFVPRVKQQSFLSEQGVDGTDHLLQRQTWEEAKAHINQAVNKVSPSTVLAASRELLQGVNVVRMRGPLIRALMRAQQASFIVEPLRPLSTDRSFDKEDNIQVEKEDEGKTSLSLTHVYALLAATLNSQVPIVGRLLVKRLILAFRKHFRRNEKRPCLGDGVFLGALMAVGVCDPVLILEMLLLLLENATSDSLDIALHMLHCAGGPLLTACPRPTNAVFEQLRQILQNHSQFPPPSSLSVAKPSMDKRLLFAIEDLFQWRQQRLAKKSSTLGYRHSAPHADDSIISPDLEPFLRGAQRHALELDDEDIGEETELNVFTVDPNYGTGEQSYRNLLANLPLMLKGNSPDTTPPDNADGQNPEVVGKAEEPATDLTGRRTADLRKLIYLTIMSSVEFEECGHKLLKLGVPIGQEIEICNMIVECCSQERSFLKYYGLLAERFCLINLVWRELFVQSFVEVWQGIHRLETNKIRNVARLFGHLLTTKALQPANLLAQVSITERTTNSSSRILLKYLLQDWLEHVGVGDMRRIFAVDPALQRLLRPDSSDPAELSYARQFFEAIGFGPVIANHDGP
jgi:pre-mRNA-splicing factor CWC22